MHGSLKGELLIRSWELPGIVLGAVLTCQSHAQHTTNNINGTQTTN